MNNDETQHWFVTRSNCILLQNTAIHINIRKCDASRNSSNFGPRFSATLTNNGSQFFPTARFQGLSLSVEHDMPTQARSMAPVVEVFSSQTWNLPSYPDCFELRGNKAKKTGVSDVLGPPIENGRGTDKSVVVGVHESLIWVSTIVMTTAATSNDAPINLATIMFRGRFDSLPPNQSASNQANTTPQRPRRL